MLRMIAVIGLLFTVASVSLAAKQPTGYEKPLLGTATLWDKADLGFTPTH